MTLYSALIIISSVFAIFAIMILFTRIFGLRTFAKMSSIDFASTIAIGSILASTILNKNQSLEQGALALFCIITLQTIFSFLVRKSKLFKKLLTNKPQFLMLDGEIIDENLKKCNVSLDDLLGKLREANVKQMKNVKAVVFESTGDISVLHGNDNTEIDDIILKDVEKL
ncbi:DUF421 domain-containing protein [Weeksellaceae bacterium KMM 9724]|uniref:DUF421 domain-containing protein n=1 Tax=Profundicola chukchiensis TaxID=2961959 RepID=UPI00243AB8C4|nr:YetF domain-containing protein [Profundicola chukchiensis]MDG4949304.1 DUF421 domain-containing protein [Profundicola chukchiensis]